MTQAIKKPHYRGFVTTKRPFAISLISVRQLGLPAFWLVLATLPTCAAMASRTATSSFVKRTARGWGVVILARYLYRLAAVCGDGFGGCLFVRTGLCKGAAVAQFKNPESVNVSGLAAVCQFIGACVYIFHLISPLTVEGLLALIHVNKSFCYLEGVLPFPAAPLKDSNQFAYFSYPRHSFIVCYLLFFAEFHFVSPLFRSFKYIHSVACKYILVKHFQYQSWKLAGNL